VKFLINDPTRRVAVIGQSGNLEPSWNTPGGGWCTRFGETQVRMSRPRFRPCAEIKRVVLIPLAYCVRMSSLKALGVIFLGRSAANSAHFIDFQVSKYPMMAIPTVLRSEQTVVRLLLTASDQ